ncbi:hypothetical protein D6792_03065 [Candidatus Parcubacteria bacterium]|nr:MAG: hypothetical protein D6792_03065 [Candidatus Parcubacteria bacterium]GIW68776.1 MAG: hypothetical protein KatS3mg100_270 [Candidatus Parcubacteria bacterium]
MERKPSELDQVWGALKAEARLWKRVVETYASQEALRAYRDFFNILASTPNEMLKEKVWGVFVGNARNRELGSVKQLQALLNPFAPLGRALANFEALTRNPAQDSIPAELRTVLESLSNAISNLSDSLQKLQTGEAGWDDALRKVGERLAQVKEATHEAVQLLERHRFFEPQANYVNYATLLLEAIANFWRAVHGEFLNVARNLTSESDTPFSDSSEEGGVKTVREDEQVTAWYRALAELQQKLVRVA